MTWPVQVVSEKQVLDLPNEAPSISTSYFKREIPPEVCVTCCGNGTEGSTLFTFLVMGKKTVSEDDLWWRQVKCRLLLPCDENTSTCNTNKKLEKSILEEITGVGSTEVTGEGKCSPLNVILNATVMETKDAADSLLRNKKIFRYAKGKWSNFSTTLKRRLKLSVRRKRRKQLGSEQSKLLNDMLQIVSFSHYVHGATNSLRGKVNITIISTMEKLEKKMVYTVCKMLPAFNGEPLDYLGRDDVPVDLRHQKRGPKGHAATYVILQNISEFFQRLDNKYNGTSLKFCSF